jgi:hypothetical protein
LLIPRKRKKNLNNALNQLTKIWLLLPHPKLIIQKILGFMQARQNLLLEAPVLSGQKNIMEGT